MTITPIISIFNKALEEPGTAVKQWKMSSGGRAVGFLLTDVPEELIHAAGFFPYGICGDGSGLERADGHLQSWACSLVRSSFALALEGKLDFLDGLIIPQTCDTTRMVSGIWEHAGPLPFMENYLPPRQVDRPSARTYLVGELARLKRRLEDYRGAAITITELRNSISLYNSNRKLLRRIFSLHGQNPGCIGHRNLYSLIRAAMIMPREALNQLLKSLLEVLEKDSPSNRAVDQIRLVMSGSVCEPLEILDYIESAGGVVVGDDLQNGRRYIEADVPESGDPLEALADRQINRMPFAGYDIARNPRRHFLARLAREKHARGVIFLHLKYCEAENYDYHDNLQALKKAGIPAMRIETEFGSSSMGQLNTRVQAFMEMVGGAG
ncbi:MAG: 2-hydroxyacyl-CoA dehydratase family protein [Firmicutes bacterium]|nr:2-hydroxyacyl-CoA dehydratase family protein [Bacillota bacterium]